MDDIKLSTLMDLEKIERGIYRGQSWDLGLPALFGGQVLGQALSAAYATLEEDRIAHSLHTYFLLPGDAKTPVVYDVERVRDGKSFSTRRVEAIQNGKVIFYMTASFQIDETGPHHQHADFPQVPAPETLEPDIRFYEKNYEHIPASLREALIYHKPIDTRTVHPGVSDSTFDNTDSQASRRIWIRAKDDLGDNLKLHQAVLAYASDYRFLTTALQPHGISMSDPRLKIATIDHAMWFHRPVNVNEWLLYVMESPSGGNSRGFVRGQFFSRDGVLLASTSQEGLMRLSG